MKTKKETSDLIDNKLCYYLMTADSFDVRDIGVSEDREPPIIDDVEKFYLIEKSYYVNKCVMILMSISNNCRNAIVIGETPMEYLSGKISSSRMKNIVTILDNIYAELSEKFKICITADESIEKIFYENSYYRARLNEFKSELDRIIKELSN